MGRSRTGWTVWRMARLAAAVVALALLALIAHPTSHLLHVAMHREAAYRPPAPGFVDDASHLNLASVAEAIDVPGDMERAETVLRATLARAAAGGLRVSLAGARHTMGGQTIFPGGIAINMQPLNRLGLDEQREILHAEAGARWDQIVPFLDARGRSVAVMQSNNSFSAGGSISANCHGWQVDRPPIASTVESLRLMKADGEIVRCSRAENAELFSLVLGGYGLFGVILDVELRVVRNERYRMERIVLGGDELADRFAREVRGGGDVRMAYGRLCVVPGRFLDEAVLVTFRPAPCAPELIPRLGSDSMAALKRTVFRGSAASDYGKELRWEAERMMSDRVAAAFVSRNQLFNEGVELYGNRADSSTDILHEYFIPPREFATFLQRLREIIPRHGADLLNVTVRHLRADPDTFLRYADQELFALVLLFNQQRTARAESQMTALTQELIDAALKLGGRYYLPYRLHATPAQFERAYPRGREFFELKRRYDPQELFQNQFYVKYGAANPVAASP